MSIERDIEFLYEVGSLRNVPRGWRQHLGLDCASDLEHTMRVAFLALMLARREGASIDETKILQMAIVHDLPETRVSDHSYVQKVDVTNINEDEAARDMFRETSIADYLDIFRQFEARTSLEAKIVKDADNLDVMIELKELEERGSRIPAKFLPFCRQVRDEKLYTQAARDFWDALQSSDPSSWHLTTNKWLRVPGAGK
jgi:putative hydrolases of HD superfamily